MTSYGTRARVKELLHIPDDETWDTELDHCLDDADDFINNEVCQYVDTPYSTVPDMIVMIANDYAAGFFCENHLVEHGEEMPIFLSRAEKRLARFIRKQYGLHPT